MRDIALAFDIGGTELRAALVDDGGQLLSFASAPTPARDGPAAVIGEIELLAGKVREGAPGAKPVGIGIGAPGPLDPRAGLVIDPPTLSGWKNVPLAAILGERFGLPVEIENDANAAALGEWRFGAGRGASSMVFVTVSTGIGGGIIADGRLLHGRRGLAGEIGHMTITDQSEPCFCGSTGCFEAVASGTALGRRAARMTSPGDKSRLRLLSGEREITGRHVIEAAEAGDALALQLVEDEARLLGIGFTNLLHLFSPDIIVMGGGISAGFHLMKAGIERTMEARAMPPYRHTPVLPAMLGRQAGLVGAASLVFQNDRASARIGKEPVSPTGRKEAGHG
ncbi:MAG: ROK family protein [Shinella sp.]|nr:ROK family protein [Shinella sp.]